MHWAPSQYKIRRLIVRSREVSKPRDLYLELSDRSEIWQALWQHCCRCACQISKRYDNLKYQSRGFQTSRDLTIRRLFGYWNGALILCFARPSSVVIVRRAGLLWSQQDFEWRWYVPLFKCLTVLEFSFILYDLCLLITFFNSIMNYVPIVTFWIFTYHKIWILSIMFCFIWSYWIVYFLACLEVSWRVVS